MAKVVVDIISSYCGGWDDGETAVCLMGHGTEAAANQVYLRLQEELRRTDGGMQGKNKPCRYFIGTVEAKPTIKDVMAEMAKHGSYRRVVLEPLMVVSGDHANHDMAGEDENSWKSIFKAEGYSVEWKTILEREGYEVECILEGLGQIPAIRDIYADHVRAAIEELLK